MRTPQMDERLRKAQGAFERADKARIARADDRRETVADAYQAGYTDTEIQAAMGVKRGTLDAINAQMARRGRKEQQP